MSKAWAGGSTTAWRKLRAWILRRDAMLGYRCRAHEEGWCKMASPRRHTCTRTPAHAHHTRGRQITGDDPKWIVSSCEPCNQHIGDPTRNNPQPRRVSRW